MQCVASRSCGLSKPTTSAQRGQVAKLVVQPAPHACARSMAPPLHQRGSLLVMAAADQEPTSNKKPTEQPPEHLQRKQSFSVDEQAPFFEPLLRNLVLGVSAGLLVEFIHVFSSAATAASHAGGLYMLPALLPHTAHHLTPLWSLDHTVAIGVWVLLYLLEARTVSQILNQHPQDPGKAAHTIRSTMTLPKRMLPLSLTTAKRTIYQLITGMKPSAAAATSSAARTAPAHPSQQASAFTTGDFAREAARRANKAGSSTGASAGASVLDRPSQDTQPSAPAPVPTPASPPPLRKGRSLRPIREPASPDKQESKRERELRERKAYLKNFWYAAGISAELKDKPKAVQILGRTVTLFRDETGQVKCMENLCPHRGASLGDGWTKQVDGHTCVVCPYHAWAFDGEGHLLDVPSSTSGTLPKRPMVKTYPVEEKGGYIWLFFGSNSMPADERPPIPWIPELDDPKWQAVYGEMEFDAPHWSTFDNALDMAHIHYVHDGSFGNPNKPEIMDMKMDKDTFGLTGSFKIHNKPVNKLWEWTKVPHVPVEVKAFMPMTSAVRITLGFGIQMITFVNTVPIDEHRSINRFCLIRNFATSPLMDGFVRKEMYKILGEDKVMVETVRPDDMPQEVSLAADLPQLAFRQLRQSWVDMGYAVDPSATTGHKGSLDI